MNSLNRAWSNLPIQSKLVGLAGLLVVLAVLGLTGLSVAREQESFRAGLEGQARLLLETLPYTIRDPLYFVTIDELQDVAGSISDESGVSVVRIYGRSGAPLIDSDRGGPVLSDQPDPFGVELLGYSSNQIIYEWSDEELLAGRSVYLGNQPIGAVVIGLSTDSLRAQLNDLYARGLLAAFVVLGVGFAMAYVLAGQIATPLRDLTELARAMAAGDLSKRFGATDSRDEIGQLGHAFDSMAESIQKRETELRELNAQLEARVAERTAELQRRNEALQKANNDLDLARKEAEAATRLKSQFLASMSHELRTPLNAITGFSQLLLAGTAGELNEKQSERLERILVNGNNLLQLINDLLDLSKIEAGRFEIVSYPFKIKNWINEVRFQIEGLAQEKGLGLNIVISEDMPEEIVGDPIRLKQIAMNLLSNAIKFTEQGSVTFEIGRRSRETWALVVQDTGIGIPSHALEFIFEEFRQVDGSSTRKQGGTGLGLAIVRRLAVMMGGTARVSSTVNEGSTFTVVLPLVMKGSPQAQDNGYSEN